MKLNKKLILFSSAILLTMPVAANLSAVNTPQVVEAAKQKNTITVTRDAWFSNSKGKLLTTYKGKAFSGLKKTTTFKYYGNPVKIKGKYYYYVGNGAYLRADYIYKINGKEALSLNHNSYVYTKSGKRSKKLLREGLSYNFTGKYKKVDTATNNYFYRGNSTYQLVTTKIKGTNYFRIAKNQYIKAFNVAGIGSRPLIISQTTATVKKNKTPLMIVDADGDLLKSGKTLKKGQKLTVDSLVTFSDGGNGWVYAYRIKGTNNYVMEDDVTTRNNVDSLGEYNNLNTYLVRPPKDGLQFYNAQGENITPSGYVFEQHLLIGVDSKMYLWIPKEHKAELVYHIVATSKSFYKDRVPKEFNLQNSFIKVADTEYWSGNKKPQLLNTPQEAEEDAKTQATSSELTNLRTQLEKATNAKDTTAYKLSAYSTRRNYDKTIDEYQTLLDSKRNLSAAEVKLATWILQTRTNNLSGKKIEVGNINKLTSVEKNLLQSLLQKVESHTNQADKTCTRLTYDKATNKVYLVTTKSNSMKVISKVEKPLTDFVTEK